MYGFDFKSKLARLNPLLFVDDNSRRHIKGDWYSAGLYMRRAEKTRICSSAADAHYLVKEARQFAEASDAGLAPTYLCGVPQGWVPEYDVVDLESGRILARGWRSTLLFLAKKKVIDLERARKVFGAALGDSDYDRADYDGKLARLRAEEARDAK